MNPTKYEMILRIAVSLIMKSEQQAESAGPNKQLCVTLTFLATEDSQINMSNRFCISAAANVRVIKEVMR